MADAKLEMKLQLAGELRSWSLKRLRFPESSFSLLVDPDCESVITLLIVIARKQQLARFVNQIVTLTV